MIEVGGRLEKVFLFHTSDFHFLAMFTFTFLYPCYLNVKSVSEKTGRSIQNMPAAGKYNQSNFDFSGNLEIPLKTHHGGKLKQCNHCNYTSAHKGHLGEHLRTHSGEKTNKCNQCHIAFTLSGNLRAHMRRSANSCTERPA